MDSGEFISPQLWPIILAALWQLGVGVWRRQSLRCLLAGGGLLAVDTAMLINANVSPILAGLIVFHLALSGILILGAFFDDALARTLRIVGMSLMLVAGLAAIFVEPPAFIPEWLTLAYPLVLTCILAGYARIIGSWPGLVLAALIPVSWFVFALVHGYLLLRQIVRGLDYLAISLALFAVAVLISLTKFRRAKVPD
jgi:hypothetical protein